MDCKVGESVIAHQAKVLEKNEKLKQGFGEPGKLTVLMEVLRLEAVWELWRGVEESLELKKDNREIVDGCDGGLQLHCRSRGRRRGR